MAPVDQQSRRRAMRTGLTELDEERACSGYTSYAPMCGSVQVYLIDIHRVEVNQVFWATHYLAQEIPALG